MMPRKGVNMNTTLKRTIKLVSELLEAKDYKHFHKKTTDCSDICIEKNQVILAFEYDFVEFYECSKIIDIKTLKYIHNIINIYLKAYNALKNSNCLSPIATHELKGMLSAAKLSIEMLVKYDFDSEDRAKLLNQSFESVSKSIDIFEEMLQIERLQHQNSENKIEIIEFDITEIINKILNTLELSIKSKNLKIYFTKKDKIEIIKGSFFWIDRAIFNLLNNAIKYNTEGGYIKIDISTKNKFMTIKIQNSSLGIDNSEKEKLFEKFQTSKSSEHIGTGIGLALVKSVIDVHGGNIELKNFENKDVAFIFNLPLIQHRKTIQNPYASLAASFIAVVFGAGYFFPVIPTFNDTQSNGKFDTIKTQNGSVIRVESDADYSFWNFRNITNSKSYKRLSLSSGYAEVELNGDTVNFVMPNTTFTNMGTKVTLEKDKNSVVSIYEGAVKSDDRVLEEGFGFLVSKNGIPKTVQLLDAPYGIRFKNLQDGSVEITVGAVKGAVSYKIIMANDDKFENITGIYTFVSPTIKTKINKDGYYYIKAIAVDKNGINGYQNIVKFKNKYNILKAEEMIKAKAFDKSLEFANKSNKDFEKKDFEPYSELGWIYYLKGEYAKSIQILNKALELKKDNERDLIHIARDYYFMKDLEKAEEIYLFLLSQNDKNQDALWGLAEVYLAKEQISQAKEKLEKLLSINPKYYMLNYDLAKVALSEMEKNKALSYLQKEIELYPNESSDAQKLLDEIQSEKI